MRIIQILPELKYGDAVGNDAIAVCKVIEEMGYETGIYSEKTDDRLSGPYYGISSLPKLCADDVVIFNHCTVTDLCYKISELNGKKVMIYHNITPPRFFEPYSKEIAANVSLGYRQTRYLSDKMDFIMPVSEYNLSDLRAMGYKCPSFVRPILIPFEDYKREPDRDVIKKYSGDGYTNIVFVGRVAPNKKHEDMIAAFAYYKKHIDPKSRLILVGADGGVGNYQQLLKSYIEQLETDDVVFTGHTSFAALLAYYKIADVYLSLSEHEGFCVPLVEAMYFGVPIVAYDSSAVGETLGGSGILLNDKSPVFVAKVIERIIKDRNLREYVVDKQNKRLADFSYQTVKDRLVNALNGFINGTKETENNA